MADSNAKRKWILRIAAVAFIVAAVIAGSIIRENLNLEWNQESVREFVKGLGWWGPLVIILFVAFRNVFLIPSQVMLVVAGACFGFAEATIYGTIGILISGMMVFILTRMLHGGAHHEKVPPKLRKVMDSASQPLGGVIVAMGTAYPFSSQTVFHVAAAFTKMAVALFALALLVGAAIRSALLAYLGNSLIEKGFAESLPILVVLTVVFLLPFLHPGIRRRLLRRGGKEAPDPE